MDRKTAEKALERGILSQEEFDLMFPPKKDTPNEELSQKLAEEAFVKALQPGSTFE